MKTLTRKPRKFTLIELIAVIVILAIISVVAIPKYLDLQDDARQSAAEGVLGAVQGATAMAYAKSQLDTTYTLPTTIANGYLADRPEGWTGNALSLTSADTTYVITVDNTTNPPTVTMAP